MTRSFRIPLIAGACALALVVLAISLAGRQMPQSSNQAGSGVEQVSVAKSVAMRVAHLGVFAQAPAAAPEATPAPVAGANAPLIARTGKVSLFVGSVDDAVRTVTDVARRNGGDVFSLQASNAGTDGSGASAAMDIRIPARRFDSVMGGVSGIGKVREHSVSAEDLTGDITDSSARLRNLRRTETDMLAIMDRSGSVGQILNVETQLSQVREQIEQLESELKSMRGRVMYSTITVSMLAEAAGSPAQPSAISQLGNEWQAAVHALGALALGAVSLALWFLVFSPVIALGLLALYLLRRAYVRRTFDTGGRLPL